MVGFRADGELGHWMSGRAGNGGMEGCGAFPGLLRGSPAALALVLGLASVVGLLLRLALDLDGALDVDTVAFGLSAWSFDPVHHQPQPPGYPGYVVLLKMIRAVASGLDPLEVAKWGSRLCGAATVPAAWWACREALRASATPRPGEASRAEETPVVRPLLAAGLAAVHPLLWYYGADGQVHAAEGLVTTVLFGASVKAKRRPGPASVAALAAAFGLAGSVRLTLPLLAGPFLLWVLWGRPTREWATAGIVGLVGVAAWWGPTVALSGGWDLYSRAGRALLVEHIFRHHSPLGAGLTDLTRLNLLRAAWGMALACLPLVALARGRGAWRRPWALALVASAVFYALGFVSEPGYFTGVAALACLVPALWPRSPRPGIAVRAGVSLVAGPLIVLLGPATVRLSDSGTEVLVPSLAHVVEVERLLAFYRDRACGAAGGRPALVVSDHPNPLLMRLLPLQCPGVLAASVHLGGSVDPTLDDLHVFSRDGVRTLPTDVPLEHGPPGALTLPAPVERVVIAPFASPGLRALVASQATCPPLSVPGAFDEPAAVATAVPSTCLPSLRLGGNTVVLQGP